MRRLLSACLTVMFAAGGASAQTVLDKVLSNVNGQVITQLDVRQARMLKLQLVTGPAVEDAEVLRGLENRRLVLAEVAHVSLPAPSSADLASRRLDWQTALGSPADLPALLDRAGLNDAGLSGWLRDDVRIQQYLGQRFGGVREADRPAEIARWLATLREHAGLPKSSS